MKQVTLLYLEGGRRECVTLSISSFNMPSKPSRKFAATLKQFKTMTASTRAESLRKKIEALQEDAHAGATMIVRSELLETYKKQLKEATRLKREQTKKSMMRP